MATSLLPRPVGGATAALSTQASPSRVFVSLPLPSADPLLSVSSALPHLSRSGPSFQKIQRGLWLAQGPGKPRDLRLFLAATLHLRKWSPSPFPKASRASEVSSEDHLVETGDSLIRQIQAGSISHSLGRESQEQRDSQGKDLGGLQKQRQGQGQSQEGRGREIHWWVQALPASSQPCSTVPPLLAGEVAMVGWAREMSTGAMAEMEEGAC